MSRLVTLLLALSGLLWKIAIALGKRQGRIELTEEQREMAEAMRADFDAIAAEPRTLDDALSRLRNKPATGRRDVP